MGCDIHAYVEYKQYPPNETLNLPEHWYCLAQFHIDRNYGLFGLMGNKPRGTEEMFDAKGLPDNLSFIVKYAYQDWEGDAHHMSWLTIPEVEQLLPKMAGESFAEINAVIMAMKACDPYETRLVFWFDN